MNKEKTYTRQEMDMIMKDHIMKNAEILRKNLKKKPNKDIEYA